MWLMMNILGSEGVEVKPETAKQTHKKSHEYDKICLDVVTLWFLFFFFWLCCMACGILVPQPGIKPRPTAVKALSLNHWTAKEFLPLCS